MSISLKRYVDITSGVGGGAAVARRELIGLLFTDHQRVPGDGVVEMTSAADVLAYFGPGSVEYARAAFYFDFVSKNITRPKKIAFARYFATAQAPSVFGSAVRTTLDTWKAVVSGAFKIIVSGEEFDITGLDFSGVTSLADVASTIQAALAATTEPEIASAIVNYDPLRYSFDLSTGVPGPGTIEIDPSSSGSDITNLIGWGAAAVTVDGNAAESPLEAFTRAAERNNNFGSFLFIPTLTVQQTVDVATANSGRNVEFLFTIRVTDANAEELSSLLIGLSGVALTFAPNAAQFDEMAPMILLAATDYTKRNASQNYMFQMFNVAPKVTSNADADRFDDIRVNYVGQTQTAGQFLQFYQRGVLTGGPTAPVDMNTYANEMWLKDECGAAIMGLLLSVSRVPANRDGKGQVMAILQEPINKALFNGTISVGKTLTELQKVYVSEVSGTTDAWAQVQTLGYWLDCDIRQTTTTDGRAEYLADYTLIYSKDDAIRKVEGRHVLI